MSGGEKQWYAVYTKPRWEKKVYGLLLEKGREAYVPIEQGEEEVERPDEMGRKSLCSESYVFVRLTADEMTDVRMDKAAW